jgi:predicted DCC family thiol-disulfide oxidoreductase YuxK
LTKSVAEVVCLMCNNSNKTLMKENLSRTSSFGNSKNEHMNRELHSSGSYAEIRGSFVLTFQDKVLVTSSRVKNKKKSVVPLLGSYSKECGW